MNIFQERKSESFPRGCNFQDSSGTIAVIKKKKILRKKSQERMAFQSRRSDISKPEIRTQYLFENGTIWDGQMKERGSKQVFKTQILVKFGNFLFP